jgi:diketogulonate reductase-like aldo/keto reductase
MDPVGAHDDALIPLNQVRSAVDESIKKLGFVPDLFLIHNPFVAAPGELKAMWNIIEDLKSEGKLKSIGVSNFRPQDLEAILEGARFKPVVNQVLSFAQHTEHNSYLVIGGIPSIRPYPPRTSSGLTG